MKSKQKKNGRENEKGIDGRKIIKLKRTECTDLLSVG